MSPSKPKTTSKGFTMTPNGLVDLMEAGKIDTVDMAVFVVMKFFAKDRSYCDATAAQIAAKVNKSRPTVLRSLDHLEAVGAIRRDRDDSRKAATSKTNIMSQRKELLLTPDLDGGGDTGDTPSHGRYAPHLMGAMGASHGRDGGISPALCPPIAPARSTEDRCRKKREKKNPNNGRTQPKILDFSSSQRQRPEPPTEEQPRPPEPIPAPIPELPPAGPPAEESPTIEAAPDGPCPFAARLDDAARAWLAKSPTPAVRAFAEKGLTVEQRAALADLPPDARAQTEADLLRAVPASIGEALKRLRPVAPPPPPPDRLTTAELLLLKDVSPDYIPALAGRLAEEWGDHKSFSGFQRKIVEHTSEQLLEAYRQATGPKAKHPPRVFMFALRPAAMA